MAPKLNLMMVYLSGHTLPTIIGFEDAIAYMRRKTLEIEMAGIEGNMEHYENLLFPTDFFDNGLRGSHFMGISFAYIFAFGALTAAALSYPTRVHGAKWWVSVLFLLGVVVCDYICVTAAHTLLKLPMSSVACCRALFLLIAAVITVYFLEIMGSDCREGSGGEYDKGTSAEMP